MNIKNVDITSSELLQARFHRNVQIFHAVPNIVDLELGVVRATLIVGSVLGGYHELITDSTSFGPFTDDCLGGLILIIVSGIDKISLYVSLAYSNRAYGCNDLLQLHSKHPEA